MSKQQRRTFKVEFKKQMVQLYENGKSRAKIVEEYDLTASALDRWIKQSRASGSFKEKDNRSQLNVILSTCEGYFQYYEPRLGAYLRNL